MAVDIWYWWKLQLYWTGHRHHRYWQCPHSQWSIPLQAWSVCRACCVETMSFWTWPDWCWVKISHPALLQWGVRKKWPSPASRIVATESEKKITKTHQQKWTSQTTPTFRHPDDLSSWQEQIIQSKGWVSIDRSVVAALPSTTPRPVHKSSTDDLGPPLC